MRWLGYVTQGIVLTLLALLAVVLVFSALDLALLIVRDLLSPPRLVLEVTELLDIFSLFLLVLIGLELLESIVKTYLTHSANHLEVVLSVALIAVARKVLIVDVKETPGLSLLGIAAMVLALSAGYYLLHRAHRTDRQVRSDGATEPEHSRPDPYA